MPRPARRILTCVLLGLLLNAAVTVACWLAHSGFLHDLLHSVEMRSSERTLPNRDKQGWEYTIYKTDSQYVAKFGLPFRSLQLRTADERSSNNLYPGRSFNDTSHFLPTWQRGMPTGLKPVQYQRFPIQPVVPGILYNTLIYTSTPPS